MLFSSRSGPSPPTIRGKPVYKTLICMMFPFLGVFLILIGILIHALIYDTARFEVMFGALLASFMGGRGPAVGICNLAGWHVDAIWIYNALLELLALFFVYPLFAWTVKHPNVPSFVARIRNRVSEVSCRYSRFLGKRGWFGLFIFVMIPLPFTGPVVGATSGYLIGFGRAKILSAVIPGCFIAVGFWTVFMESISGHMMLIRVICVVLILFSLTGIVVSGFRLRRGCGPATE